MKTARVAAQIFIAVVALCAAAIAAGWLLRSAPETTPEEPQQAAKIVQVIDLKPGKERISVIAWGTVIPAREVTMRPQVGGRVVEQNEALVPGGLLSSGDEMLSIDRADYDLALVERTAELEEAKFESEVERGRQAIAQREWELLKGELPEAESDSSLALREPHLRRTAAMVKKAESAIEKAQLDLERTVVSAPFNGMVVEESVEVGQLLEPTSDICRLVGTDAFWVRATLPMAELSRVRLPEKGKPGAVADIHLDTGNGKAEPWQGTVVRLLADLEDSGRMARLLVQVDDPLDLEEGRDEELEDGEHRAPLLLGSYVRVDIDAGTLNDVLSIPRAALREGNRLWLVGSDNRLRVVPVEILWTRPETVLVENVLQRGERLVVSELRAALPGMDVSPQVLDPTEQEGEP
jgi:RND family efflux transporter MFP subunit